ncbi:hypothetical protein [Streptomyces sp. NPDC059080]|uniref:hypothetical protein n=1 Tax=Streptomyces sp. NPDC059080 TaxID=3346718 RepID=UPI0036BD9F78
MNDITAPASPETADRQVWRERCSRTRARRAAKVISVPSRTTYATVSSQQDDVRHGQQPEDPVRGGGRPQLATKIHMGAAVV